MRERRKSSTPVCSIYQRSASNNISNSGQQWRLHAGTSPVKQTVSKNRTRIRRPVANDAANIKSNPEVLRHSFHKQYLNTAPRWEIDPHRYYTEHALKLLNRRRHSNRGTAFAGRTSISKENLISITTLKRHTASATIYKLLKYFGRYF